MSLPGETYTLVSSQVARCGYLQALTSFRALNNTGSQEYVVLSPQDFFSIKHFFEKEPISDEDNLHLLHNYDLDYLQALDFFGPITAKYRDNFQTSELIPARVPSNVDWNNNNIKFYTLLNLVSQTRFKGPVYLLGDTALRRYLDYPRDWNDFDTFEVGVIDCEDMIPIPGVKVTHIQSPQWYVNSQSVDCLQMVYDLKNEVYWGTGVANYAIQSGCNTLYLPKYRLNYEYHHLSRLECGFGLRVPRWKYFLELFNPDPRCYTKTLKFSNIIYAYLLDGKLRTSQALCIDPEEWYCREEVQCVKALSPKKSYSQMAGAQIIKTPSLDDNETPVTECHGLTNCTSPAKYPDDNPWTSLVQEFDIIVTGGILSSFFLSDLGLSGFGLKTRIHFLTGQPTMIFFKRLQQVFGCLHVIRCSDGSYSLLENSVIIMPKNTTVMGALKSEVFDFAQIGYTRGGYVSTMEGEKAIQYRLHFSTLDAEIPFPLLQLGFRRRISPNFVVTNLIRHRASKAYLAQIPNITVLVCH